MASKTGGILHDQNLNIRFTGSAFDGNVKSTKAAAKKDGRGLRSRKALGDITNKAPLKSKASTRKRNLEFNVAEEGFLHDHTKCIEAQKSTMDIASFLLYEKNVERNLKCGAIDLDSYSESTAHHLKIDLDDEFPTPELHNHQECINARLRVMDMDRNLWQMIRGPDHGNQKLTLQTPSPTIRKKIDLDDEFPSPPELLSISKWNSLYSPELLPKWRSPPDSPPDSLEPEPDSPFPWRQFVLKQENDCFDTDSSV